ncbi:MAG: YeeE/YedE thiosulfate transporter family protein [Anaerolineales bacterium]|nr:YeeE/YedE thiosulfate transporter family protein [Anaerolineales bacterium]
MYPFPLQAFQTVSAQNPWTYVIFGVIGFFFGYILESSGFGNSRKLAAQFYFRELTVLKVMFGAIVTAMVLLFTMIGLGLVDYNLVYVNPTYLSSGILGGLIMGVGFILGGFCPGTSLVATATGKLDGLFFLLGGLVGIFLFGETEPLFDHWWQTSGYLGRFTLMDWLGLPNGVVVTIIVLMALFMFWGAEQLERIIGKRDMSREPKFRLVGAAALLALAVGTIVIGVPDPETMYQRVSFRRTDAEGNTFYLTADQMLAERLAYPTPAEVYHTMFDRGLITVLIDVRPEADYNLYHINGAINVPLERLPEVAPRLQATFTNNTVYILMSNDEELATQAWKYLVGKGIKNVYILEGGINNWIAFFGKDDPDIIPRPHAESEQLRYTFPGALGARYRSSYPSPLKYEELEFEPRIQLELKRDKSGGGCG